MLIYAQVHRETRQVTQIIGVNDPMQLVPQMRSDNDALFVRCEVFGDAQDFEYIEDEEVVRRREVRPASIEQLRAAAWGRVKSARAFFMASPITVDGRTFDADEGSQAKLSRAASRGVPEEWTLADNTSAQLTGEQLRAVDLAIAARSSAAHARARGLRAQIDAATTAADLDTAVWSNEGL